VVGLLSVANVMMIGANADGSFGPIGATLQRTYYPGGISLARAQPITVRAGLEVAGIDLIARPFRPEALPTRPSISNAAKIFVRSRSC
jgi:hypothetical protein